MGLDAVKKCGRTGKGGVRDGCRGSEGGYRGGGVRSGCKGRGGCRGSEGHKVWNLCNGLGEKI